MAKFRFTSAAIVDHVGRLTSKRSAEVDFPNLVGAIEYVENNGGWIVGPSGAFKVNFIEEVEK